MICQISVDQYLDLGQKCITLHCFIARPLSGAAVLTLGGCTGSTAFQKELRHTSKKMCSNDLMYPSKGIGRWVSQTFWVTKRFHTPSVELETSDFTAKRNALTLAFQRFFFVNWFSVGGRPQPESYTQFFVVRVQAKTTKPPWLEKTKTHDVLHVHHTIYIYIYLFFIFVVYIKIPCTYIENFKKSDGALIAWFNACWCDNIGSMLVSVTTFGSMLASVTLAQCLLLWQHWLNACCCGVIWRNDQCNNAVRCIALHTKTQNPGCLARAKTKGTIHYFNIFKNDLTKPFFPFGENFDQFHECLQILKISEFFSGLESPGSNSKAVNSAAHFVWKRIGPFSPKIWKLKTGL